jgi:DNA-binding transcriptional ArsR family regulator
LGRALGQCLGRALGQRLGRALGRCLGRGLGQRLGRALGEYLGRALDRYLGRYLGQLLGRVFPQLFCKLFPQFLGRLLGELFPNVLCQLLLQTLSGSGNGPSLPPFPLLFSNLDSRHRLLHNCAMMQQSSRTTPESLFAALGNDVRLRIVGLLTKGETCLCEIAPLFRQDQSVICRHLQLLERAGVVLSRRDGQRILYRLADHRTVRLVETAMDITEHQGRARPIASKLSKAAR